MANTLTQLEEWRTGSPLYSDWSDHRLTAYHDITTDLFTIGRFTLTRTQFIKRYGEPGVGHDVIRWQPSEKLSIMDEKVTNKKMDKNSKNLTLLKNDPRRKSRMDQSSQVRRLA